MIDPALAAAFDRVAARQRDVAHAFEPGFEPELADIAGRAGVQRDPSPLSVAAPEGTYFAAASGAGGGGITFSRAGGFALDGGELRFAGDERPVLGFGFDRRTTLVPLRVDPVDAALGRVSDARIDPDGTFAYTRTSVDPRTGERRAERVAVGRLALARFPAGTQPERVDATHVRAPHGVAPHVGAPGDGSFGALAVRSRDLGRVDVFAGLEGLRAAYDGLDAVRAAGKAHAGLDRTAMDLLK
jgi:hypothetical protein